MPLVVPVYCGNWIVNVVPVLLEDVVNANMTDDVPAVFKLVRIAMLCDE